MSLPNDSPDTPLGDVSVRINAKLLAAVVVATLVVVVGSIMMRRYWIDRNASILVERADKRLAANDVSGAIKDLGHYLKLRPTDYDVMLKLADCLESAKASEKSIYLSLQLLGDFLLQHRDRVDVRKRLVLLLVELQSYGQVLDEQLPYLIEEAPTDPVLFGQILECFEATDARDAGADFCLRMIEKNPAGSANYLGLLRLVEQQRFPLLDPERVAAMFEPGEAAASPEATSQDDSSNSGSPDDASPDDDSTEGDSTEDDSSAGDSPAEPDPQTTPSQRVPNHDLIEAILAALLKNAQPEIDGLLAAGRFRLAHGKAAEAERLAAEALKLDPQSVEANLLAIEASLQSREMALVEGDRDRAAAAREQAVERATTLAAGADADWRVLQILAQLRVEENQIDDAEQCIRRAIAAVEQGRSNLPLATRNSREIIDRQFQVHWALADLLLSPAVQRDPVRREQASAELDSLAKTLEKMQIRREVAQLLEARRLVAEGQWARAAGRLEQLRTDFYGVPRALRTLDEALLECYEQLQNPDAKIRTYRRALIEDPSWYAGRVGLGTALAQAGFEQRALSEFEQAALYGQVPAAAVRLQMAEQMLKPVTKRDWTAIDKFLNAAETRNPWASGVVALRAELLWLQGQTAEAEAHLAEACTRSPADLILGEQHIAMHLARNELPQAERADRAEELISLYQARVGDLPSLRLLRARAGLLRGRETSAETLRSLAEETEEFAPEQRVVLYRGLAGYALSAESPGLGLQLLQRAQAAQPDNVELLLEIADVSRQQSDEKLFLSTLERIRKIEGADGPNANFLAGVDQFSKSQQIARQEQEGAQPDPQGAARNARFELLESALQAFSIAVSARPTWALAHRYKGLTLHALGRESHAHEDFMDALRHGDRSRETLSRIISHLSQQGRDSEIVKLIQSVADYSPLAVPEDLARIAIDAAINAGELDWAETLSSGIQTQTLQDKLTRARLLMVRKQNSDEVKRLLHDATEMGPGEPLAWSLRVEFLARAQRLDEGRKVVEEAAVALPQEPPDLRPRTLARCYEILGDIAKAEEQHEAAHGRDCQRFAALQEHVDFCLRHDQVAQAQSLLRLLLDHAAELSEEQLSVARLWDGRLRGLVASTYSEYEDALQAIEADREPGSVSTSLLRAQAEVLTRSRRRHHLSRLIDVLEELSRRDLLNSAEQRQLAWLYEQIGRRDDALAIYRRLREADSTDATAVSRFIQAVVNEPTPPPALFEELIAATQQLQSLEPRSLRTTLGQCQLLTLQNDAQKAIQEFNWLLESLPRARPAEVFRELVALRREATVVDLLQDSLREQDPRKTRKILGAIEQLRNGNESEAALALLDEPLREGAIVAAMQNEVQAFIGQLYERLNRPEDAEAVYRRLLAQADGAESVRAMRVLATYYARRDRLNEALAECDTLADRVPPQAFIRLIVDVARIGRAGGDVCGRIEGQIQSLLAQGGPHPQNEEIRIALADLYNFQGKADQAARVYEEVLQHNPNQLVALNNLAWFNTFHGDQSQKSGAEKLVNRAIEIAGPVPGLLDTRGMVLINLGQPSAAISDFARAAQDDGKPAYWLHLAIAQLRAGSKPDALESWKKAESLGLNSGAAKSLDATLVDELRVAFGR